MGLLELSATFLLLPPSSRVFTPILGLGVKRAPDVIKVDGNVHNTFITVNHLNSRHLFSFVGHRRFGPPYFM